MANAKCLVALTDGNIRNNHFYLRSCRELIPEDGIGGPNAAEPGTPFTVKFEPGAIVETDVDGAKMILRNRSAVRDFFERSAATAGDTVLIERTGPRSIKVRLEAA